MTTPRREAPTREEPPRRHRRRTQAERRAETRRKIVRAVVESIDAVGFQRTTAAEVTRRAGVTWGAVQHHFGGKAGILRAALEDSFQRFAERLGELPPDDASLETRVDAFVERAWGHFSSAHYRSTLEILLHHEAARTEDEPPWQDEMLAAWSRVWNALFPEARRSAGQRVLQRYAVAVLTGLATTRMLGGTTPHDVAPELALLKATLVGELRGAGD